MRNSQIAMLGALGVLLLMIVGLVASARIAVSNYLDGSRATAEQAPSSSAGRTNAAVVPLTGFTEIRSRGSWQIQVTEGDTWSVEVYEPEDEDSAIDVSVRDGALILESNDSRSRSLFNWFGHDSSTEVDIVMPSLSAIDVQGSADIDFSGFAGERLSLVSSGAINVDADDSEFDEVALTLSGMSNVDFKGLSSGDANVNLSGFTNVHLRMEGGTLSGQMSGFGNLTYAGSVAIEDVRVSGFSRVAPGP